MFNARKYRERCIPIPQSLVRGTCDEFVKELDALVQKYKIQDVLVTGMVATIFSTPTDTTDDDGEGTTYFVIHIGDSSKAIDLACYAHDKMKAECEQRMLSFSSVLEKNN